jgi:hypothetical protein
MYIENLNVRNVRLLAEQDFSFLKADGTLRLWTVIVGENGVCKSTLLQAIALAAMGPKLGSALVKNSQRLRNLDNEKTASITATFQSRREKPLVSSLRIDADRFDLIPGEDGVGAEFLDELRAHRRPNWFVVGYGVGRFLGDPGKAVLPVDPGVQRLNGLFDARHPMLGLDFYRCLRDSRLARRFSELLHDVLSAGGAPGERLLPGICDFDLAPLSSPMFDSTIFELWVEDHPILLPADWLSDGYQATLSWIADLLGYALLEMGEDADPKELQGIVLLDEIDLHLHPTWQRRIVPLLREIFPRLQFIVNTHSPLVLAGFEREEIILLKLRDGEVVQDPADIEPGVLSASEILTSFFDVQRAGRPDLVQKERRFLELRAIENPLGSQSKELRQLARELDPYWTSGPADAEMRSPEEILKRKA